MFFLLRKKIRKEKFIMIENFISNMNKVGIALVFVVILLFIVFLLSPNLAHNFFQLGNMSYWGGK